MHALLYLLIGCALGFVHFRTLALTTALYLKHSMIAAAGLHLARLAAVAAVFIILSRIGAMPLLMGFAGFLMARAVALFVTKARP